MLIIDKTIQLLFLIILGSLPFFLLNWYRYVKELYAKKQLGEPFSQFSQFPNKSVIAFVAPILMIFILSYIMTRNVRADVTDFLSNAKDGLIVKVENMAAPNPQLIVEQLKQVSTYPAHHTHPERIIHILIEANGRTLALNLGRDSARPNEYWVFYPDYRHTSKNEIGRITTNLFDSY